MTEYFCDYCKKGFMRNEKIYEFRDNYRIKIIGSKEEIEMQIFYEGESRLEKQLICFDCFKRFLINIVKDGDYIE